MKETNLPGLRIIQTFTLATAAESQKKGEITRFERYVTKTKSSLTRGKLARPKQLLLAWIWSARDLMSWTLTTNAALQLQTPLTVSGEQHRNPAVPDSCFNEKQLAMDIKFNHFPFVV